MLFFVVAVARRRETSIRRFENVPGRSKYKAQTGCGEVRLDDETNQRASETGRV